MGKIEGVIFDTGLIISIIAINMTVIGLTSLADMKKVIGIDYGKFLLRKYKIFGFIRVYYLLILFGVINVLSLFLIFVPYPLFRFIHFLILLVSLFFAIYYFFAYIIVESNRVKKQIYELEVLGLYYSSDEVSTFEADIKTGVCNGSRTTKKMSGNIIDYFNLYNSDTHEAFVELFGLGSLLYKYDKRINKKRKRIANKSPYAYRQSINNCSDISHEFFQLYRYTENQDKWILTILDLFDNSDRYKKIDYIRLCNFTRVIEQINVYGFTQNLFTYKFLEHLFTHYRKALLVSKLNVSENEFKVLSELAIYANDRYFHFMVSTYINNPDPLYLSTMNRTIKSILGCEVDTVLLPEDHMFSLLNNIMVVENEQLQTLFAEMLECYYKRKQYRSIPDKLQLDNLQVYIHSYNRVKVSDVEETKRFLFSENGSYEAASDMFATR